MTVLPRGTALPARHRLVVLAAALVALAVKLVVAARTLGTSDIKHWDDFVAGVAAQALYEPPGRVGDATGRVWRQAGEIEKRRHAIRLGAPTRRDHRGPEWRQGDHVVREGRERVVRRGGGTVQSA